MVEIYESEEAQVEALKAWWKENGRSVIVGAIMGVTLLSGWNFWQAQQKEQAGQASAMYGQLLSFIKQDKAESAQKVGQNLIEQYGKTAYADYARLIQAKLKVQAGDIATAKILLETQMKQANVELQNVARIRLIRLMLATGEYEQGLQLVAGTNVSNSESFSGTYDELTGDLYVALDRLGEARTSYQKALRLGQNSPLLQFKLDDITAAEIIETP